MPTLSLTGDVTIYEGYRLKDPTDDAVFLVLDGKRWYVPDNTTLGNLFGGSAITLAVNLDTIPRNPEDLSSGAILARPSDGAMTYLISNNRKRHIVTGEALAKYGFHGNVVPQAPVTLAGILDGPDIV